MKPRAFPNLYIFVECVNEKQCVTPGTYAMVGAAAAMAGVTRISEHYLTKLYILPIMITVMVSKWVADSMGKDGIFDALIYFNGYPMLDSNEEFIHNTSASVVMTKTEKLEIITASDHTVDSLGELLRNSKFKGYPVVNSKEDMLLVGYAGRAELLYALVEARRRSDITGSTPCTFSEDISNYDNTALVDLRPWIDQTPTNITPRHPLNLVVELFKKLGLRYVLVTSSGSLHGLITKKDLLRHVIDLNHSEVHSSLAGTPVNPEIH
ncbi:hypothetical protein HK096_008346 [Nowakowskiella sp. JEL0078]|nr:hypothetical protein HK096_008346 [Nowakowskiella sp. JEL0078]